MDRDEIVRRARAELQKEIDSMVESAVDEALEEIEGALPEGYHGRWNELTVADFKFLHSCGIPIIWKEER